MIYKILKGLREQEGTLLKISFLNKHKDNELLKKVLSKTYDTCLFTFGISVSSIRELTTFTHKGTLSLDNAVESLTRLVNRELTGQKAKNFVDNILESLNKEDAIVFYNIINRSQKLQLGRTQINKVWSNLITKQLYAGCNSYTTDTLELITKGKKKGEFKTKKGTSNHINFPAYIQLKSDGTYREFKIINGTVSCKSRSGKVYTYPGIEDELSNFPNGYVLGELTVILNNELLEQLLPKLIKADVKNNTTNVEEITTAFNNASNNNMEYTLPRGIANGLLNSSKIPQEQIRFTVWDYITIQDYTLAARKDKANPPKIVYKDRFEHLIQIVDRFNFKYVKLTDYKIVLNLEQAVEYTQVQLLNGLEGGILKDFRMLFKDGRSNQQLKMKLSFSIDCRITHFIEGTPGTVREDTFGAIGFKTDDGLIMGSTSGFTKEILEDFNNRREELIGKIIEVEANDLTRSRSNVFYALSHPRYVSIRDKDTTDTLESAMESLESAKLFKKNV